MICAVDIGVTGAIAFQIGGEASVEDIPNFIHKVGKKNRTEVDQAALAELLLANLNSDSLVLLERVGPRPHDGAIQSFKFGRTAGILEGILVAAGVKAKYVTPQSWKKKFQLSADKNESLDLARTLFPELAQELKLKKHHNRAEALLLLRYAEKYLLGGEQ